MASELVVEPHMVERVTPGGCRHTYTGERVTERRYQEQHGWMARRGSLQAWSMSRDAACALLGFMEGCGDVEESK